MTPEEIEIHMDEGDRPFEELGPVKVRVTAKTAFSKQKTIEEVDEKLRETAAAMGANGVVGVAYKRGISMSSWKALTATGRAVRFVEAGEDAAAS